MIGLQQYLDQHAASAGEGELTQEVRDKAGDLVVRVNRLLSVFLRDTGLSRVLRSGWRPAGFNANFEHTTAGGVVVRGGAIHSTHMSGEGVDVADNDEKLDQWITDEILEQFGLYREAPASTPSWCHLQTRAPHSGNRTFIP